MTTKIAFVTGATGFTGSHLVRSLLGRGWQVRALARSTSDRSRLAGLVDRYGGSLTWIEGDLSQTSALLAGATGATWVFHTAAYVELGLVDADRMAQVNIQGTANVLAAAKAAGVDRLVYCSTIGVLGDTQGRIVDETFQRQQVGFDSPYDRTKYEAQVLVDRAAAAGLPVISVLPSGIFGGDDPHFGPVLRTFVAGKLKLWAGGDRITGIVHVDDLVEGMILAAERGQLGAWYILSAGDLSTRAMFSHLGQACGQAVPAEVPEGLVRWVGNLLDPIGRFLNWQPPLSRERVYYVYDRCVRVTGDKARRELGWNPRSVEQVLETVLKELQADRA